MVVSGPGLVYGRSRCADSFHRYIALYVCCLAIGIGCSVSPSSLCIMTLTNDLMNLNLWQYAVKGTVLLPAWSIIVFSIISAVLAVVLGFSALFLDSWMLSTTYSHELSQSMLRRVSRSVSL